MLATGPVLDKQRLTYSLSVVVNGTEYTVAVTAAVPVVRWRWCCLLVGGRTEEANETRRFPLKAGTSSASAPTSVNFIPSHHHNKQTGPDIAIALGSSISNCVLSRSRRSSLEAHFSLAERTAAQLRREGLYKQLACAQNGISNDVCSSSAVDVQSRLF